MKMSVAEFSASLSYFYCSEDWHQWSALFPKMRLSDGAKFVAEEAGAYWLMDIIGSYQGYPRFKAEGFQTWQLTKKPGTNRAVVRATDGNGNVLAIQENEYTDFPLDTITLYLVEMSDPDGVVYQCIELVGEY